MAAAEPIRDKGKLKQLADYFLHTGRFRDYALVILGVHTALRIGDLLSLKWIDVYDFSQGAFRSHIHVTEKKTGKDKLIALNTQIIHALWMLIGQEAGKSKNAVQRTAFGEREYIFANNRESGVPISRVQAWRIIREAAQAVSISGHISCHSLRKTFGYHAWSSGVSPVVLMDIYNHSSYETTRRYLGVTQDDLDSAYLGMELF